MKVKLTEIKAATKRVRKDIGAQGIEDLAESIQERGIICPPKVRKNGDGYTTVYGHRRIAAARMAGLEEIEAIVEDVDDMNLMLQAGMENLSKEDMNAYDKGEWVISIEKETGWSLNELSRQAGISVTNLWNWKEYHIAKNDGTAVKATNGSEKIAQTIEIARELEDPKDKKAVAKKVGDEDLTWRQARSVAAEYKRIKTEFGEKHANKALATPFSKSGLAPYVPTYKPAPVVKPVGDILFQWVRDQRVIDAEIGLKAISACVSDINRSIEDRGGGKAVLKNLIGRTEIVLNQMHEVLDAYDK